MTESEQIGGWGVSIVAAVLAAGASRRFGTENKLLHDVEGDAVVCRVVRALVAGGVGKVGVVVGCEADRVRKAFSLDLVDSLTFHDNPRWDEGMGSSLRVAVRWASSLNCRGLLVCLGDLPWLDAEDVRQVVERFVATDCDAIVAPRHDGKLGHPVCFPTRCLAALAKISGDRGAKSVIKQDSRVEIVDGVSDGCVRDLDSPHDPL